MACGVCEVSLANQLAWACSVTKRNCSMAAGRYTSVLTVSTFFLRCCSQRASLAVVVVLPAPCKPAISTTAGGWLARLRSACWPGAGDITATNSRCTTPTSACPGVSEPTTSWPNAACLTLAKKSRVTATETSASSKAMRTSRSMSATLLSVMRAWPRICLMTRPRRSVRTEAIRESGDAPAAPRVVTLRA